MIKVLFLDIDGVMKPGRAYWDQDLANDQYGGFDPLAVAAVNHICARTGAVIVFNTVWNLLGHDRLLAIAKEQGIMADIHQDCVTAYPHLPNRLLSIREWINEHPETSDWAALDDCPLDHDNAVTVDGENGISLEDYRRVTALLGNEDKFIVLL